jgi:hypothetical protein
MGDLLDYAHGGQKPQATVPVAQAIAGRTVTAVHSHDGRIAVEFDDGASMVCHPMPGTLIVRDAEGVLLHAS